MAEDSDFLNFRLADHTSKIETSYSPLQLLGTSTATLSSN